MSFSIIGSLSCLGDEENSIFIYLMSEILSIHPSTYTSLLLIVHSVSPTETERIPLGSNRNLFALQSQHSSHLLFTHLPEKSLGKIV